MSKTLKVRILQCEGYAELRSPLDARGISPFNYLATL